MHYFSLEQANAVVTAIRPMVKEILEIREKLLEKRPLVWPVIEKGLSNGGSREAGQIVKEFEQLQTLVSEIRGTGAILRDINTGLVDFPALREGEEIYFCWRYGENEIGFWHGLDGGFKGRQPLP